MSSAPKPPTWEELLARSNEYLVERQDALRNDFDLNRWEKYFYDQETESIRFSSGGKVGLVARIQVVGSTSKKSGTWLWAWDNPSIVPRACRSMLEVKKLGIELGFKPLTEAKWTGDERDAWEMTAVASLILRAQGGYRSPDENGALFMVLFDVRRVDGEAEPR